jgi:prepilin-type N-terminal cleavage/methylation domain-containing protein
MRQPATNNQQPATSSRGFTMIELLVVITIIVLMLSVAVPLVRTIQGNRTLEVGYNTISSAIGHARQIALYYRAPAGIAFYQDPNNGYQTIAYVMQEKNIPRDMGNAAIFASQDDRYFDIIPGEQLTTLPQGVAVQVFDGVLPSTGLNSYPDLYMRVGIVLFDEEGQLSSAPFFVRQVATVTAGQPHLGDANHLNLNPLPPNTPLGLGVAIYTSPAVCLYDEESYLSQPTSPGSPQSNFSDANYNTQAYSTFYVGGILLPLTDKWLEQTWLSQNGETLVIKPNDGSLLRNK